MGKATPAFTSICTAVVATSTLAFLVHPTAVLAGKTDAELIANARSAAPPEIAKDATVKSGDGKVLRKGSNGWTCYPGSAAAGPMCQQAQWDAVINAWAKRKPIDVTEFSVSYMLAGDGDSMGVSNVDPFATKPTEDNQWVKEGPHLMILVPDPATLEGLSTNPEDPVYVMWKGTPYAHIMVKTSGRAAEH